MSPELGGVWLENARMPVYVGGAEANVACALATWGQPVAYCTAMPDHYLGRELADYLSARGVDTRPIQWTGSRVGTYYLPQGTDLQNAGVVYDRADSAFARLKPGMLDWDVLLAGTGWFHFSAISPALNRDVAAVCREALDACIRKEIRVSVDLNYRPKLWKYGVAPVDVMPELVEACDVVMGNLWAAESLLGIPVDEHIHREPGRQRYLDHSLATSEAILRRFPRCGQVAHTFRFEEAGELRYYATLYEKGGAGGSAAASDFAAGAEGAMYVSTEFHTRSVVDKVGSGDCFMAGLIHGIALGWSPSKTIHFAAAAAFGKLQEQGDSTRQSEPQIEAIVQLYA